MCLPALFAAKKPITIDSLMQMQPPRMGGTPIWAPDGKRFAFIEGGKISLYDVPSRSGRELLTLEALSHSAVQPSESAAFDWRNRRVTEQIFQWLPSGTEALLTAGGDLFLWHAASGKWDQLTATPEPERDAQLSPDGSRVAFRRGHDLYALEIASRKVTRLTHDGAPTLLNGELDWVYPEELDLGAAFWWSPDSTRIAYLQFDTAREFVYPQVDLRNLRALAEAQRYPQAGTPNADVHLGVVAAAGGETRWMDVGDTRDALLARVHWTPDSARLGVERFNRVQNKLDFVLADAAGAAPALLFRETDPYWINYSNDARFLKDGRLLWSSERDGHRHLYLYSREGKLIRRLTEGNWDIDEVAGVDEARGRVYYLSTEPSPLERHLFVTDLDRRARKRLTQPEGTHGISLAPNAAYYLDLYSSLAAPTRRVLFTGDGAEWTVYREADRKLADEYDVVPSEIVSFPAKDGLKLYARLMRPVNFHAGEKYPAVVMVYGGPHAQSIRNAWLGAGWDQVLAQRGFVVWQVDNRGSAGRGHGFESALYRRFGEKELSDQKDGVARLLSLGIVDPARIGMYGWSYGGYMTLYSLLNAPDLFRAGIAGAPVTNWTNYDTIYTERYLGLPAENAEGYRLSSPVTYAANLRAKLLLLHNLEDDNVLFQNTLQMAEALEKAGKQFEMVIYPQKTHGVGGPLRRHLMETATEFFERTLKAKD